MPDQLQDVDISVLQSLQELMQDDFPLLIDTFLTDAQLRIQQLRTSLTAGQMDAFRQAAHSFKGSCGNMGAQVLERACLEAEAAGLAADRAAAEGCLRSIEEAFLRVRARLG